MYTDVIKRDGRTETFRREKISHAIALAMGASGENNPSAAVEIAAAIANEGEGAVHVETIQDRVEQMLMEHKLYKVSKAYILYRAQRTGEREKRSGLNKRIKSVVNCSNVQNSNANVNEYSFGGRKFEAANVLHKEMALDEFMRPEVAEAHRKGVLYTHDLSEYTIGDHNCLFADVAHLLSSGFSTRNGDVRPANSFATACQLVAVIFQAQSQCQFGGVASAHIDYDLAPYVKKSFAKHFRDGLKYIEHDDNSAYYAPETIRVGSETLEAEHPEAYRYAVDMMEREGNQGAQALFHNLNTLESRPGSQVPFTSLNYGTDTSPEGRLVSKWLLKASLSGIGKHNVTPIFPISIWKWKRGVNDAPNTPNYDLTQLALKSLSRRIYPNILNCGVDTNVEDGNDFDTEVATMGCRTMLGYDRNGMGYKKTGRGNVCPVTINLPRIGIRHGTCTGERTEPDIEGFWAEFRSILELAENALLDRFTYICSQNIHSADFMYANGTVADADTARQNGIYESMKHGTLAIGYIGVAEMCKALFGKDHSESEDAHSFALDVVRTINEYAAQASKRNGLNFSCYATPAENLAYTFAKQLKEEFGEIAGITDREYITNSHHVPVWQKVSIYRKLQLEAPFCKYATAGCITYIELEGAIMRNQKAIEGIVRYAMDLKIPYLAFNFPIDFCEDCGYQGEIEEYCPVCGGKSIKRLRRVTGYLSSDYRQFNAGKVAECLDRVKHSAYTDFAEEGKEV